MQQKGVLCTVTCQRWYRVCNRWAALRRRTACTWRLGCHCGTWIVSPTSCTSSRPGQPPYADYLTTMSSSRRSSARANGSMRASRPFCGQTALAFGAPTPIACCSTPSDRWADVEKMFHLAMRVFRHPTESRMFYAPDSEPSVEADLPILDISGLSNFMPPRRAGRKTKALTRGARVTPASGSGPGGKERRQ